MSNEPLVELKNIDKTFGKGENSVQVLRGIGVSVVPGEKVAIRGASGAGKSTLLHIMGTLERPTSGQVFFENRDITDQGEEDLAVFRNRCIGFVFQFHHLLPEFTALENVMMPALVQGIERQRAVKMALNILIEVGLGHRLSHKPGELSGGEQQRVAVARALILDPPLLLADEPSGNLDSKTGKKIQGLLIGWARRKGRALVVATHDEELAGRMTRQLMLKDGKVTEQ